MKPTTVNLFLMQRRKTQKEIAEHLNLDKSTVSLLLSGKLRLDRRLDEIAQYLGITRRRLDQLIASNGGTKGAAA
ncbi:MAG: helix-turn-helix transcriptional regulator [Deltaproteobacteria bacterium]|nr:helix-turn-helix transcriptional regulator [Deltaproteobacteria bacterium]MBI2181109.1 helix-turn-helix transcriptional regulator [Deltaproteobacteria bacterium]MBI2231072.1 helix-turn-helix transcriptional regulator [Deltaproteobacteria bacterium]MBI2366518.1 helix-turn-helix transcriptional regulator [Deltaproteobacteria bacterium]MBI2533958.1 helix-turn-helix transcriptional regulator [Deltaproteobacteria bacterium]